MDIGMVEVVGLGGNGGKIGGVEAAEARRILGIPPDPIAVMDAVDVREVLNPSEFF
jgi:hypothetical protein